LFRKNGAALAKGVMGVVIYEGIGVVRIIRRAEPIVSVLDYESQDISGRVALRDLDDPLRDCGRDGGSVRSTRWQSS